MKILIHCDEYYPTAQACAYRMQVFAEKFVELGDDVIVITSSANKANGTIQYSIRKEKIIYSPAIRMKKKTTVMRILNSLTFGITSIVSAISIGKVDVVITTSPPPLISISGWIIAKCKTAKLIYDVRDIWPDVAIEMGSFKENSIYFNIFQNIAKFMYKNADVITTVSPGKIEKIKKQVGSMIGCKSGPNHVDKIWLVGNGFDESIANSTFDQSIVDKYEVESGFTCVYIGNIGLAQGLGVLLEVAAKTRHKDVRFLCFGMGAEKEMLERRVANEGLENVKFCGVIEHDKVFSVLSCAKLAFIPLKNSNMKDSVPTKVYEAIGIGCPVFLVAEGDATSIVAEAAVGRSISPDKPQDIVAAFDDMIDLYETYYSHRQEAINLMHDKYSRQKIAEEFEYRLKDLCKQ